MNHLSEEDLVLLYYGEPGPGAEARLHLKQCAGCEAAARSLAETLNACSEWSLPEPDRDLGRSVWARIAPLLEDGKPRPLFRARWWMAAATLAAMLILAFTLGRATRPRSPAIAAGLSKQARERILEITVADHLDRAGMLLTEISNEGDIERGRAQDLVDEGRLLRQTLADRRGFTATVSLLDEVERFMLEVANEPDRPLPMQVRMLRERIESGSLIFKIRIIESNLRSEGQKI